MVGRHSSAPTKVLCSKESPSRLRKSRKEAGGLHIHSRPVSRFFRLSIFAPSSWCHVDLRRRTTQSVNGKPRLIRQKRGGVTHIWSALPGSACRTDITFVPPSQDVEFLLRP